MRWIGCGTGPWPGEAGMGVRLNVPSPDLHFVRVLQGIRRI
jgi:hypothetical protein